MSPTTMIEQIRTVGIPLLTSQYDEEFGEEIVESFIAHVNAMNRAQGQSDVCIGALAPHGLSGTIHA